MKRSCNQTRFTKNTVKTYPLQWPVGRQRLVEGRLTTKTNLPLHGLNRVVESQVEELGGKNCVISSNADLRLNGELKYRQPWTDDLGVAVWFQWPELDGWFCISCDHYDSIIGNLYEITQSIRELRPLMVRLSIPIELLVKHLLAAQTQDQLDLPKKTKRVRKPEVLPDRDPGDWRGILELKKIVTWDQVQRNYVKLVKRCRRGKPDELTDKLRELDEAISQAKKKFGFK